MVGALGMPPASTTCVTFAAIHASTNWSSCGCMRMRFTPNGFCVICCVALQFPFASNSGGMELDAAITPNAPALLSAETRLRSLTQLIAPPMMACSHPSSSRPRAHRVFRDFVITYSFIRHGLHSALWREPQRGGGLGVIPPSGAKR
jgi:hypothetical protein